MIFEEMILEVDTENPFKKTHSSIYLTLAESIICKCIFIIYIYITADEAFYGYNLNEQIETSEKIGSICKGWRETSDEWDGKNEFEDDAGHQLWFDDFIFLSVKEPNQ